MDRTGAADTGVRRYVDTRLQAMVIMLAGTVLACAPSANVDGDEPPVAAAPAPVTFDGAGSPTRAGRVAHGERLAGLLGCPACHGEDYTGNNFGAVIPLLDGLWASNISVTLPKTSDGELERILREGVHPEREIYLMPSKQSQFLSAPDMEALIAYLRTVEPAGEPTPLPPPGFEAAVTARLPADYWLTSDDGKPRAYHNAAEEVAYFAENAAPDLGHGTAQGRLVALTVCASCHGAAMDGVGEPAGGIQAALMYDDAGFERLLRDGVRQDGSRLEMNWGTGHAPGLLTDGEIRAAMAYTRLLAKQRSPARQ